MTKLPYYISIRLYMKKLLYIIFAFILQLLLVVPLFALTTDNPEEVCSSFKDVELEQSFITNMLSAASNGTFYRINPDSSKAGFCVHGPMGLVRAEFKQFDGAVALPGKRKHGAAALVTLDVGSLESDTIFADSLLKSDSFLDAETYPKITFAGKDVVWINPEKAVIKGSLTMHGVTRDVAFYVEFSSVSDQHYATDMVQIKASTTISRSEFGLDAFDSVEDKVNLCMQVDAVRYYVDPL